MEKLPVELSHKIFCVLDHQNLAAAQLVCRKWKGLASDNSLWANLFIERWGEDQATFFNPSNEHSWRHVYAVQDRCDRYGLGVKIIREGVDYYLISRGEIQRHLGSKKQRKGQLPNISETQTNIVGEESSDIGASCSILDKILCFIGDLETTSVKAKRNRTT